MKEMIKAKIFYNPNSLFEIRSAIKFYEEIDKKQFNKFVMWEEYNRFMKSLNNYFLFDNYKMDKLNNFVIPSYY